jgi:hypothetical protein
MKVHNQLRHSDSLGSFRKDAIADELGVTREFIGCSLSLANRKSGIGQAY